MELGNQCSQTLCRSYSRRLWYLFTFSADFTRVCSLIDFIHSYSHAMRHGCSSGVALIICMQHTQKGMMAVKSSLNNSLIIFQNHYFFSFFGGALLQSLSLPARLPGEGMGVVIRCHPPIIREESLCAMSYCCADLLGFTTTTTTTTT